MAYNLERLEQALVNADKAGDTDAAKAFAGEIRRMRQPQETNEGTGTALPDAFSKPSIQPEGFGARLGREIRDVPRQLGLTARHGIEGVGDVADLVASPIRAAMNMAGANIDGRSGKTIADYLSLPEPATPTERVVGDISRMVSGGGGVVGAANKLAGVVPGATQSIMKALATRPELQLASAAGAGGAGGLTREAGGDDLSQAFAALAGGIAAPVGISGTRAILNPKLSASDTARQAALDVAGKAGLYVPRSNIKETTLTNLGERFGGKQAIEASAQAKNQPIFNRLASKSLGIADDTPITPDVLSGIRKEAGKSYEAVKNVGLLTASKEYKTGLSKIRSEMSGASKDFPELASADVAKLVSSLNKKTISSEGAVEMVKNLRNEAKSNFGPMASAKDKLLGKAQRKAADLLDDLIESNIEPTLGKEMLASYRKARELIAKTYTVENALVGQNVSAQKIARTGEKIDLKGELKQIADFANSFKRLSRVEMGAPPSGGLLEPMLYGGIGGIATGGPGAAAAAIPIIGKPIARKLMVIVPKVSKTNTAAQKDPMSLLPAALYSLMTGNQDENNSGRLNEQEQAELLRRAIQNRSE